MESLSRRVKSIWRYFNRPLWDPQGDSLGARFERGLKRFEQAYYALDFIEGFVSCGCLMISVVSAILALFAWLAATLIF